MRSASNISFCFYTSTKGHFGRKTDWRLTLNHWGRQLRLSQFNLIAHLKISDGDEQLGAEMSAELRDRGFHVIETLGSWSRGMSHQTGYMGDCIKVSKDRTVYDCPYYLHVEDDSPIISRREYLYELLSDSIKLLEDNHETLSVRTMRRGDDKGPITAPSDDPRLFWSEHVNFQPLLMRSLDFYRVGLALEANPQACQQVQCEMLWRLILANFSRSPYKHAVWEVDYAEALHIGTPQEHHEAMVSKYNLV
jgi:hypothetical protein